MNLKIKILLNFIKGLLMGICDIIPGVSGGTIALLTGIYEKILQEINNSINFAKNLVKKETNLTKLTKEIDLIFLLSLLSGIGIAIFTLSHILSYLIEKHQSLTNSFFLGLILASIFFISKKIEFKKNIKSSKLNLTTNINNILFLIIGTLITFNITILKINEIGHSNTILFFSGFIAICAMILPGISGAFILLLLNQYDYVLEIVKNLQITKILIFGIGAICGIIIFSKILNYLIKNYKNYTFSILLGLILGSLKIFIDKINFTNIYTNLTLLIIGFLFVYLIENLFLKIENKNNI